MGKIIAHINTLVWGAPALVMILGVGLYLTWRLHFAQFLLFPQALKRFTRQLFPGSKENRDSSFQALCTALAATVGTGNLVGVAGAICIGGPGSIFWMWICGLLGMATKFAEATLSVHLREKTEAGYIGGPMHMIPKAMGPKWLWLGKLYSIFGIAAAFGVGNATQINAVVTGVNGLVARDLSLPLGLLLAVVVGAMLLGGANRIGQVAEYLVPIMSGYKRNYKDKESYIELVDSFLQDIDLLNAYARHIIEKCI